MPALTVHPVRTRADRSAFVALPYGLRRDHPHWVLPLRRDVRALLAPENPFYAHGEAEHFLARLDGRVLGRISAIHNRLHNEVHGDRAGFFGFFDCVADRGVAADLLEAAAGWLRARGLDALRGPASYSTNEECGLLVDGFDTPNTILMPHNPRYYPELLEAAGLRGVKDLLVYERRADALPERLVRGMEAIQKRYGLRLRTIDMKRFAAEVGIIKNLYNQAWEKNWGFVPMTDAEIDLLAEQLKPVVAPSLVVFAEKDGQPIGFAVALPDLNVALAKNPSGRLFPGILRVLWAMRRIDRCRVLLAGVVPEWRGHGVDALLYGSIWQNARACGIKWGEAGSILEDNPPMRNGLVRMGFDMYKTYRMYERGI